MQFFKLKIAKVGAGLGLGRP